MEQEKIEKKWEMLGSAGMHLFYVNECSGFPFIVGFLYLYVLLALLHMERERADHYGEMQFRN